MDKRKKYLIGLDTETCNGFCVDGKMDLTQSLVYDIGWAVVDKKGNVFLTRSFVVAEVFIDMKDVMASAYYAKKIPQYWDDLKSGKRELKTWGNIIRQLRADMKAYNIEVVFAHNASFDYRALNNTQRYITKSKYRFALPYGCQIWDTLKMARQVYGSMPTYQKFCEDNGYMTKHKTPRCRFTAEILWRFLSGNNDFEESHTGLEDVLIEKEILAGCFRQHKHCVCGLWDNVTMTHKTKDLRTINKEFMIEWLDNYGTEEQKNVYYNLDGFHTRRRWFIKEFVTML